MKLRERHTTNPVIKHKILTEASIVALSDSSAPLRQWRYESVQSAWHRTAAVRRQLQNVLRRQLPLKKVTGHFP